MQWRVLVVMAVCLALGGGCFAMCGSKEESKNLNRQNLHAGDLIESRAEDPEIRQAGRDIKLNAAAIEKLEGPPPADIKYSPEESERLRKEAEEAAKIGFWTKAGGVAVGLGLLIWGFVKQTAAKHLAEALETVVGGTVNVTKKAATGQPIDAQEVKDTMKAAVSLAPANVQKRIEDTLVRVKNKVGAVGPQEPPAATTAT